MIGTQHSTEGRAGVVTVPELIRDQARRSPDSVAVESAGHRLTYAQLIAEATAVAAHLGRLGIGSGDVAAVAVPRGVDLVPALLGIQLAGAAYLPLDPEHPADRLNYILADSRARVLVTAGAAGSGELRAAVRVHLDDIAVTPEETPEPPDADAVAYVIYTSGSTGRPKGVAVSHRAFANFIESMRERPGLPDGVVLPAVTTVSFDIAGLELFLPLTVGGRVVVARPPEAADPRQLAALLTSTGARVMQATPITWRLLLETGWAPPTGFTVLCGGERLPADLAERLLGDGVLLWDLYGPTETTVWSSVTRYERGLPAQFHPVRQTTLHLLDDRLRPVPPGTVGELYIGGAGLAAGYLRRPALTAARFVADPRGATPGTRLYRTGDLARRHPGGRVEILGRVDDQIKVRGFRIEPGEVEHLLATHPGVAEAAVRTFGDTDEATRLVGYVRPADPADPPDARQLRLHLARSAPAYMIPAQFVVLPDFPRTPNGKLDRAALPAPAGEPAVDVSEPPAASTTEERIAKILAEVLGRPSVGVHEDFFALGGDSLLAVQIVLRLNEELQTEIPINALFAARTVYGLAAVLDGDSAPAPQPLAGARVARLSAAQWRVWLHQQSAPASTADNAPLVVHLPGPLNRAAAESALAGLLERQAILRTRYRPDASGSPTPVVPAAEAVSLTVEDGDPGAALAAELGRPFDLAEEPPVRVRLFRHAGDGGGRLLMVIHRIAADDRSLELIERQLRAAYRGRVVPAPPLGYGDYAEWQRELSASPAAQRHLDFWRTALAGLHRPELPTDRPRPAARDWQAGTVHFGLPADVVRRLRGLAAEHDTDLFAVLLTGFAAVVGRSTSGTELTVGVPAAARDRPELEILVGMIEETAVIRVTLGDPPVLGELARRVGEAVRAAAEHAVLPFEDIVGAVGESGEAATAPGRNPLFDVFFALQPAPAGAVDQPLPDASHTKMDLRCLLRKRPDDGLDGRIVYATQLFDQATIAGLAERYAGVLARA
ncbi:MAG TPA: amino acid adenylation domain-containing protein [Actinoplanes sp.]